MSTFYAVRDITTLDVSPLRDANGYCAMFFITFMAVCGLFGFNLGAY
jgi:hypothetical protein